MASLVLLVVCFAVGLLARRSGSLPPDSHRAVNAWVMLVSLPALVFRSLHGADLSLALLAQVFMLWVAFSIPALAGWVAVRRGASVEWGAVALCAGLGNTAFVGMPLVEALSGRESLGAAAMADQLGTFLPLFAIAVPYAAALGGGPVNVKRTAVRLLRAPAMVALVVALATREVAIPGAVEAVINRLADMMSPLALAAVGWQLDLSAVRGNGLKLAVGLGWKLVAAPALVFALLWVSTPQWSMNQHVIVLQSAMAPMVTAGILASENRLGAGLASALIAVGTPLSLVTVALWHALMRA